MKFVTLRAPIAAKSGKWLTRRKWEHENSPVPHCLSQKHDDDCSGLRRLRWHGQVRAGAAREHHNAPLEQPRHHASNRMLPGRWGHFQSSARRVYDNSKQHFLTPA